MHEASPIVRELQLTGAKKVPPPEQKVLALCYIGWEGWGDAEASR